MVRERSSAELGANTSAQVRQAAHSTSWLCPISLGRAVVPVVLAITARSSALVWPDPPLPARPAWAVSEYFHAAPCDAGTSSTNVSPRLLATSRAGPSSRASTSTALTPDCCKSHLSSSSVSSLLTSTAVIPAITATVASAASGPQDPVATATRSSRPSPSSPSWRCVDSTSATNPS